MDREQRPENRGQILFCRERRHGLHESAKGDVEKFLDHLIAYNSISRLKTIANESCSAASLHRLGNVEGIDEDVCVEKVFSAHSFRRA